MQEGRREGRREGLEELVLRLARKKFSEFETADEDAIRRLSCDKLQQLGEALLDCSSIEDLRRWFE